MKKIRTTVSIPAEQYARLQQLADDNGLSLSWVVREAVGEFLVKIDERRGLAPLEDRPRRPGRSGS